MYLNPARCAAHGPGWFFYVQGQRIDSTDMGQWMIWVLERTYLWGEKGFPEAWAK